MTNQPEEGKKAQNLEVLQSGAPSTSIRIDDSSRSILDRPNRKGETATDQEWNVFVAAVNHYQLNPFLKEIYLLPGIGPLVGKDGLLTLLKRDPNFKQLEKGTIYRDADTGRIIKFDYERGPVQRSVENEGGWRPCDEIKEAEKVKPLYSYCHIYGRDGREAHAQVVFNEYNQPTKNSWQKYKTAMSEKSALNIAAKEFLAAAGLVSQEEVGEG